MKTRFFLLIIVILWFSSLSAQSIYMKDFYNGKRSILVTLNRVNMDESHQQTFSGLYKIGYTHPITDNLSIEGMISYHNNRTDDDYPANESGIGNIYLGINKLSESGNSNYSLGLYLPTMSDKTDANLYSYYHLYDVSNLARNRLILTGNYSYQKISKSGFIFRIEVGPDVFIDTKGDARDKVEMNIRAAGQIGYKIDGFKIFGEISNLFFVTEDPGDFKDRFFNHFGVGASYALNNFEIGLNYKNTFEDYPSYYNGGLGINMKFFGF